MSNSITVKNFEDGSPVLIPIVKVEKISSPDLEKRIQSFVSFCLSSKLSSSEMERYAKEMIREDATMTVSKINPRECWFTVGDIRVPSFGILIIKKL